MELRRPKNLGKGIASWTWGRGGDRGGLLAVLLFLEVPLSLTCPHSLEKMLIDATNAWMMSGWIYRWVPAWGDA